jgi:hypothetical protein
MASGSGLTSPTTGGRHARRWHQEEARKDEDRQDEVENRPGGDRGRARPERRAVHGAPARRSMPMPWPRVLARGRIGIAKELDVAAEGKCGDLPARAAPVGARKQHRAEADAEHLGMDPRPAADDVMAVFMHRDDDRQRHDEGDKREGKVSEVGISPKISTASPFAASKLRPHRPFMRG